MKLVQQHDLICDDTFLMLPLLLSNIFHGSKLFLIIQASLCMISCFHAWLRDNSTTVEYRRAFALTHSKSLDLSE